MCPCSWDEISFPNQTIPGFYDSLASAGVWPCLWLEEMLWCRTAGMDKGCIQEGEGMSHPIVGVGSWLYKWGSICWELGKLSTLGLPGVMGD